MDDKLIVNDLLDAYGTLLTEKQQSICDLYFREDESYQEIADLVGISRAAVFDTVKRCRQELSRYESLLHIVKDTTERRRLYENILRSNDINTIHRMVEEHMKTENQEDI
ncbi:MAG: YlxM family DNA-binding protein [Bulleidia sp.]